MSSKQFTFLQIENVVNNIENAESLINEKIKNLETIEFQFQYKILKLKLFQIYILYITAGKTPSPNEG